MKYSFFKLDFSNKLDPSTATLWPSSIQMNPSLCNFKLMSLEIEELQQMSGVPFLNLRLQWRDGGQAYAHLIKKTDWEKAKLPLF